MSVTSMQRGKEPCCKGFANATDALARTVAQIGLLMASYDTSMGVIDGEKVVEIGWTVSGLGDLLLQLEGAREQIEDAQPARAIST